MNVAPLMAVEVLEGGIVELVTGIAVLVTSLYAELVENPDVG